jgi:DNA-binding NtrC family response regulator
MTKVLVLDDVWDAGELVRRILERKGYEVIPFTEEEEALGYIKENQVEVAILDMKLKKMSGVEVLEELLRLSPETKVLMLTGYPTLETARESLQLGAKKYLVKPIDKQELEEKVAETLEQER